MAANPIGELELGLQLLLSFAIGNAAAPALAPFVQNLSNDAWAAHPSKRPDAILLSQGVAQGQVDPATAAGWAKQHGFDSSEFAAMVDIANVGPPLGMAYQAWRRGALTEGQFATAVKRQGIEDQWLAALEALKLDRLDLGAIATAVHRGIMSDAGLLVTPVPGGSGKVPRIPQSSLDTLAEFAAQGIDPERARVLVADTGLPLSLGEMLQLYNRGEVTETDVKVSIAESNVRNEYMDVALNLARRLLTPHEYAEAELRGVLTHTESEAGAALSGLNADDYATLFANLGRPISVKQITTGLARGGKYGGGYDTVPAGPYRDAIRRSAVRPEYADLDYANRYSYPSLFQLSRLVTAGTIDAKTGADWATKSGLAPEVVTALEASWGGTGTGRDTHVAKAQTQLWTTTHRGYLASKITDTDATNALTTAGVAPASIPNVLLIWQAERDLDRKTLTPAQTKKAYTEQVVNPATGAAWTFDEAIAALIELGYNANDARVFLEL